MRKGCGRNRTVPNVLTKNVTATAKGITMPRTKPPAVKRRRTKPPATKKRRRTVPPQKGGLLVARKTGFSSAGPNGIYPAGGHLIDPPLHCPYRKYAADGGVWTDFGCCQTHCLEKCDTYREDKRATPEERIQRELDRGVHEVIKTRSMVWKERGCQSPECTYHKDTADEYCCKECAAAHTEYIKKQKRKSKKKRRRTK